MTDGVIAARLAEERAMVAATRAPRLRREALIQPWQKTP